MLKHLEDEGDLNMIIDDDGNLLIVCPKCRTVWHGRFTPALLPGHPGSPGGGPEPLDVTIATRRGAGAPAAPDRFIAINPEVGTFKEIFKGQLGDKMMTAYLEKSDLLKDAGIDMESLDDIKTI